MPKFSILCPSFNHEQYVGFFIESVLKQEFRDFELIIVDDCSKDNNVKKIQQYNDTRIKLICHSFNQGINASLNTAFKHSSGEIIIFCASDDMFEQNALNEYNKYFQDKKNNIIVPSLTLIDIQNQVLTKQSHQPIKMSREKLLNHLFLKGNCLTSPGLSMRRDIFERVLYPLPLCICNQQDTQMHIKLLLQYEYTILDEKLVKYRLDIQNPSISAQNNPLTKIRENLETQMIMDTFLQCKDLKLLKQIFSAENSQEYIEIFEDDISFFLGKMALLSPHLERRIWGYHKIMKAYDTNAQALHERYNFTFKSMLDLALFCKEDDTYIKKYKKYKKFFKISLIFFGILLILFIILEVLR
ncbi:glycosyl transferase family 2 [Campylobacter sp. MIT 99-7217]|uniref:glycosyltransferase family 2 protein n=1 Tax=Campylobacter sp. MIT 99-7217 TaxID=535091 RepID=UPI00115703C6|nr:glycosyltransferase family A protein [Campylobacter sp. MIT 99-7217]TQR33749.1 glycosyl transferase family 2 [Campylobacter sp. MIT 99-7217]